MYLRHIDNRRQTVGIIAATICNANAFRGKDTPAVTPEDFFPDRGKPEREQTLEEQIEILTSIFGCGPNKPSLIQ